MDSSSDKEQGLTREAPASPEGGPVADDSRRRFSRNAVVGGAVFLSLGNRAAWGVDTAALECVSGTAFTSMVPGLSSFDPDGNDPREAAKRLDWDKVQRVRNWPDGNTYNPVKDEYCQNPPSEPAGDLLFDKTTETRDFLTGEDK